MNTEASPPTDLAERAYYTAFCYLHRADLWLYDTGAPFSPPARNPYRAHSPKTTNPQALDILERFHHRYSQARSFMSSISVRHECSTQHCPDPHIVRASTRHVPTVQRLDAWGNAAAQTTRIALADLTVSKYDKQDLGAMLHHLVQAKLIILEAQDLIVITRRLTPRAVGNARAAALLKLVSFGTAGYTNHTNIPKDTP